MQTPLQVTFRSMPHSDALATHVAQRAEKLDQIFDRIVSCHVVVELAGHHHEHGDRYHVSINVGLPGKELLVNHAPTEHHAPKDAYESADLAFDDAERRLEDWMNRRRDLDRHGPSPKTSP